MFSTQKCLWNSSFGADTTLSTKTAIALPAVPIEAATSDAIKPCYLECGHAKSKFTKQ